MMAFPENKYQGEGRYSFPLTDIVGLYAKQQNPQIRNQLLQLISPENGTKKVIKQATVEHNQKKGVTDFQKDQQNNISKAIRRQVEFYFSDQNFKRDKYMQQRCNDHPEGYMHLKDVVSFNKMRPLS